MDAVTVKKHGKRGPKAKPKGSITLGELAELLMMAPALFQAKHVCPHDRPFCTHERCEKKLPPGAAWPLLLAGSFLVENRIPVCLLPSVSSSRATKKEIQRLGKYC
jgi:hypothetical protein